MKIVKHYSLDGGAPVIDLSAINNIQTQTAPRNVGHALKKSDKSKQPQEASGAQGLAVVKGLNDFYDGNEDYSDPRMVVSWNMYKVLQSGDNLRLVIPGVNSFNVFEDNTREKKLLGTGSNINRKPLMCMMRVAEIAPEVA